MHGANIHIPKLFRARRALILNNSWCKTLVSSLFRPPPPYSFGSCGAVQPFSPILSSHSLDSGLTYSAFLPPHTSSSGTRGVLILGGQFSSNHSLTSFLNNSRFSMVTCANFKNRYYKQIINFLVTKV